MPDTYDKQCQEIAERAVDNFNLFIAAMKGISAVPNISEGISSIPKDGLMKGALEDFNETFAWYRRTAEDSVKQISDNYYTLEPLELKVIISYTYAWLPLARPEIDRFIKSVSNAGEEGLPDNKVVTALLEYARDLSQALDILEYNLFDCMKELKTEGD